ncbi:endonuclease NucS domain-containing protein [Leptolyngbya sp. PCC 6406]|uniref:endonuclease NucS domain-containing protein n=1 Tax=Leptolyngbya sp. PCC 6406 TaxID=1173264 RepID=UPI0002AC6761|nr:endonuclease NucS domain-containing protein [Leptolyngbya sp. PCC 6406]
MQEIYYRVNRIKSDKFEFADESALEDFIWNNIKRLFRLTPIRRQHHVSGNYCDILAVSETGSIAIIELKNSEDRYVVQQITRYYNELLVQKPYSDKIDYQQPIDLIVISPNFHKDNFTDKQYSKLNLSFIEFKLSGELELYFDAQDVDSGVSCRAEVPFLISQGKENIIEVPSIPRSFNTGLSRCEYIDSYLLLAAREKIIKFDNRIKEIQLSSGDFLYGKGKTKPCAQIRFRKKKIVETSRDMLDFGLWLPIALYSFDVRSRVTRVMLPGICLNQNYDNHDYLSYRLHQQGVGRTRKVSNSWSGQEYLWHFLKKELKEEVNFRNLEPYIDKYCSLKQYSNPTKGRLEYMEFFLEIALDTWKYKLDYPK